MKNSLKTSSNPKRGRARKAILVILLAALLIAWWSLWSDFFQLTENWRVTAQGIDQLLHLWLAEAIGPHELAARGDVKLLKAFLEEHPDLVHSRDSKGRTPFHYAALNGHVDACYLIEGFGGSQEDMDDEGKQPIDLAFQNGHFELQSLTTEVFEKKEREFGIAFCKAIKEGNVKEVERLLDINSNIIDEKGSIYFDHCSPYLPLQQAVIDGNKPLFELLIDRGVKINDPKNGLPLQTAIMFKRWDMAKLAIDKGADVAQGNPYALYEAAWNNSADWAEFLIRHGAEVNRGFKKHLPGDMYEKSPVNALEVALLLGNVQTAEVLLSHGAILTDLRYDLEMNYCMKYPQHYLKDATIMHYAAIEGYIGVIDILTKEKVSPDITSRIIRSYNTFPYHNRQGPAEGALTPLECAAITGRNDSIIFLLKKGAHFQPSKFMFDVDGKMEQSLINATVLDVAAMRGNVGVVKILLENGMDPNDPCEYDATYTKYITRNWAPLQIAAYVCPRDRLLDVMEELIRHGAEINNEISTTDCQYPAYFEGMSTLLLTMIREPKQEVDVKVIKMLLEQGANAGARDKEGRTILLWAARNDRLDIIKLLIDKGADVNEKDYKGRLALHWAALGNEGSSMYGQDRIEEAKYLLENGLEINAKDKSGATALHYAAMKGDVDLIKFLIKNGAYINIKDSGGETPLDYAFKEDSRIGADISPMLKSYGAKSKREHR